LGRSVHSTKKNKEALVVTGKEIGLEVTIYKSNYTVMSRDQNSRRSHNIKTHTSSFERVEQLKYLGTIIINQNFNQEEIKSRLKSGNACYRSVQNLLSSSLLSNNIKIKIYGILILSVVFYVCETWSLTLMVEPRLRVFENRVLRKILGLKRD
jgi:hypothetical protein